MKYYLFLLLAWSTGHSAQAQLLNKIKERATNAVRSAVPVGGSTSGGLVVDQVANKAQEVTEKESIIFSKTPFKEGQTTSTATDFLPTDNIYARVIMPETIYHMLEARGKEDKPSQTINVGLTTDVEGGYQTTRQTTYCTIVIPQASFKKSYFDLDVLPAANNITTLYEGQGGSKDHIRKC